MSVEPLTPGLISVETALATVLAQCSPLEAEEVPLGQCAGRYLAAPLVAALDLPPFTNSAMDGYAVRAADTPGVLRVIGESAAGAPFTGGIGPGEAVAISTGAVLPDGADCVAIIEEVRLARTSPKTGLEIEVGVAVTPGDCVRRAGSDVSRGAEVLTAGTRIGAAQVGTAAALGMAAMQCARRPRVAVLATGTELRAPGEPLAPGQIYNSNGPLLEALVASAGAEVTVIPAAADTREAHRDALEQALSHDVALSTGGVSVGGHDLVRDALAELGVRELFWRIAMKPGKPLSFGVRGERGEEATPRTLVFGIPGNPVSVLVCFEMFVRPAISALQGSPEPRPAFKRATLAAAVSANPQRDELIRVRRTPEGRFEPLRGQQSHQLAVTAAADGLARIPAGASMLPAGTEIDYLSLSAG
jgi:molybdopterin molybdotransferase